MAGEAEGLTKTFSDSVGSVLKHSFSIAMVAMMVSVALPAVAAAAPAGAATLGDVGLSLVDHYITMFTAPFEHAGTIGDVFNNTMAGDFAPGGYELGGGHGAHEIHSAVTTSTETAAVAGSHAAGAHTATTATASGVAASGAHASTCAPFNQWASANPAQLSGITAMASGAGMSPEAFYTNTYCHH